MRWRRASVGVDCALVTGPLNPSFLALVMTLLIAGCVSSGEPEVAAVPADESAPSSSTFVESTVAPTTNAPTTTEPITTVPATTPPPTTALPDPIELLVEGLSLEDKVGQLLMPVLLGTRAGEVTSAERKVNEKIAGVGTIAEAMATFHLGGVLYLGDNITSAPQLTALSAAIQTAADATLPGIGALIAVDQEGGRVNRITDGVETFPAARSMTPDAARVQAAAGITARGVAEQGVNIVLAPVADLTNANSGVITDRSYSADPSVAAEMVVASVLGIQDAGLAAAVKHWPGHGSTSLDSHSVLPSIDVDELTWRSRERVPFAAAVEHDVAIVMVGHLALPGLDPSGEPATVSSVLVEGLLRRDLGFDGVVMTDALDMGAVRDQDRAELAVQAIEAGVDILLATPSVAAAYSGIVAAVESGRLPVERIDASVVRILRLKARVGALSLG